MHECDHRRVINNLHRFHDQNLCSKDFLELRPVNKIDKF